MTTPTPPADAPTPRTDALARHRLPIADVPGGKIKLRELVDVAFARQLERELAGTLHSLDAMSKAHADKVEELAAARALNDTLAAFVLRVSQQKPSRPDYWNSCGQCENNSEDAKDLISAYAKSKEAQP